VTIEPSGPPPRSTSTPALPAVDGGRRSFAIALGTLVWGLVFSRTALLVGGAHVLCCIGWGIESVHEYRQSIRWPH